MIGEKVVARITSRGYWDVVVRPATFDEERIPSVVELDPLLESLQVRMGGWYFPHLDSAQPAKIRGDCIEAFVEFDTVLEFFRFQQSGQFVHLSAFREDWPERAGAFDWPRRDAKPGDLLGIGSMVYRLTYVYEFAARAAQRLPGSDDLVVEVVAHNIGNRLLVVDSPNRAPLFEEYRAVIPDFRDTRQLPRATLLSGPRALAAEAVAKLLVQFQWRSVNVQFIAGWQEQMFPTRS